MRMFATLPALLIAVCAQANPVVPTDTSVNQKETRHSDGVTAENQVDASQRDSEITRLVRQQLMERSELSTNAHNVKIITQKGRVLLKGPVDSLEEKRAVGRIAREASASAHVINQTYVKQ